MVFRKGQAGFTVIELLISIGLFGLVAPSISLAIMSINRVNDRAADLTMANVLAENKLESLRSQGYNALTNGSVDFTSELPASFTEPRTASYTISTPTAGLKNISITIQYTDQGQTRSLSYASIIGELGVGQ